MQAAFTIPTKAAPVDSACAMKIKTGIKAGNTIDDAQRAIGRAEAQVSSFVNRAGAQAQGLASQIGNTWSGLIGKLS
jgi:hypothetical protein